MADLDSGPLSFKGTSPEECEAFVATIRRGALTQGKHRDNEWMAVFASSCFVGDAFYWYEELGEDTQNDWSRLRPALVARFGRGGLSSTSVPVAPATAPATNIPTPAAAPPTSAPRPSVRKGRLKAIDEYGNFRGYITKQANEFGVYRWTSKRPHDALSVSFTVLSVDESFEIHIIVSLAVVFWFQLPSSFFSEQDTSQFQQVGDTLAVGWSGLTGDEWLCRGCIADLRPFSSRSEWAIERRVWRISEDAELNVEYPKPDGSTERLSCNIGPTGWVFFKRSTASIIGPILSLMGLNNLVGALTGRAQPNQPDRIIFEDVV